MSAPSGRTFSMHRSASAVEKRAAQQLQHHPLPALRVTEQDVQAAVASLEEQWTAEKERLHGYLQRNYNLQHGLPLSDDAVDGVDGKLDDIDDAQETACLVTALRDAALDQTPKAELDRQLGAPVLHLATPDGGGPLLMDAEVEDRDDGLVMDR